ncbi:membrane dipeptidase [bacterium AH-315-E09]|nr:membrane dipeptidase [bacterium AH-315-E09]
MKNNKIHKLHEENIVVDAHLDLGLIIYNFRKKGQKAVLANHFLNDFRSSSFNLIIAAIFVRNEFLPDMALKVALKQVEAIYSDIAECRDNFFIVTNKVDLEKLISTDKIGILLSLEGADPIGMDLELLDTFYRLGVRGLGLTWSRRNFVADGSYFDSPKEGTRGGLTPFGIQVVSNAEKLGMFIDASHLNDEGFADLIKYSNKPFIASHSNARTLNNITRNLSDKQSKEIVSLGGVIGINGYKGIVSKNLEDQNINKLCDHIEYLLRLTSNKNVGFGFDFCNKCIDDSNETNVDVLSNHSEVVKITEELLKRGINEDVIIGVLGRNFYEYLRKIL